MSPFAERLRDGSVVQKQVFQRDIGIDMDDQQRLVRSEFDWATGIDRNNQRRRATEDSTQNQRREEGNHTSR
ncbi:MAG: hypothetical protein JRF15_00775 [Deltaproteobacteria bacterium]|nr:hypothetical protein [Deltaproteobacteria bacterium]